MTSVGVQCNTAEENMKVLSAGGQTKDEPKGMLSNGYDTDKTNNIFIRTSADGMSVPHLFQEKGQIVSSRRNVSHDTTHIINALSNKTSTEVQNKDAAISNIDCVFHKTDHKTDKQKPVAVVIPIPRIPVIRDPEETFVKQVYSPLSNNDETIEEGYPEQRYDVLPHEPFVTPVPRIKVTSDLEETFVKQGYSLSDNIDVTDEGYPQQMCDFPSHEPFVTPVPRIPVTSDLEETFLKQGYSLSDNIDVTDEGYPQQICDFLSHEPFVTPVPRIPVTSDLEETFLKQGYSLSDNIDVTDEGYPQQVCDFLSHEPFVTPVPRIPVTSDLEETFLKQKYPLNENYEVMDEMCPQPRVPVGSECICKYSQEESYHIEHIEELYMFENVTEPLVVENICLLLQVPFKNYSERKIEDNNNIRNWHDENECISYERDHTYTKYRVHNLLSEYQKPIFSHESESSEEETFPKEFDAEPVKVNDESSIPLAIMRNLIFESFEVPFTTLCVFPLRRFTLSESLESESIRRETFQNFESLDIVERLAGNGYWYNERENEISCHFCGGRWHHGDIPERSHRLGCQYQDEPSSVISNISPARSMNNETMHQFQGQTFWHLLRENATRELDESDEHIPNVNGDRNRNIPDNWGNLDDTEGSNSNRDCGFLEHSYVHVERLNDPIITYWEGASDRLHEERPLFSAISHYSQMREDQLRIFIDYFRRQMDRRGPRGGQPITVLPYDRGRRHRSRIIALSPSLPVQESEPPTNAADNHTPNRCTFPHDHTVEDLRNDGDACVTQRRTELEWAMNWGPRGGQPITVLPYDRDPGFTSRHATLMPMSTRHKCAYCRVQPVSVRYEPCQHMIACTLCASSQTKCRVCGKDIKKQTSMLR